MNELNKRDKFTLYVFFVVIGSSLFSSLLKTILNSIFNKYESLNYVIFICVSFLLSSVVASLIISLLAKKAKSREELYIKLFEKVSKGQFNYQFPATGKEQIDVDIKNFNIILKDLNSVTILKEDFISNFSHEFKTPITSIKGFAEILQSKPNLSEKERNEYLQIIIDESEKLTNLSKNILLMGKLNSQIIQDGKEKYYLDEQITESILVLDNEITKKQINTDIDLEKIEVYACKMILNHIWTNLLTNAIKFTKDQITIKAYIEKNNIIVKFSDNGIGISKEDINHIFDKYYQCNTDNKSIGTGLGLSIVKRVVDLVNGKIEVESELNKGTTFTITIPKSEVTQE